MPANQLLLTGVPAFVGQVLGPTRVKFFLDENEFDLRKSIEVDLAKNTDAIPAARWGTDVEVDHQMIGGLTTIGPRFPRGRHEGGVYLSERLYTQYAPQLSGWPKAPDAIYQFQAVLRENGGVVTRYHGFKVRVLRAAVGSLVHLAFIPAGASAPAATSPVHWIDLSDPAISDPRANGFTTIDTTSSAGTEGALFLTSSAYATLINPPKYPPGQGW